MMYVSFSNLPDESECLKIEGFDGEVFRGEVFRGEVFRGEEFRGEESRGEFFLEPEF